MDDTPPSPPCRILCSLFGVVAIAFTPNGQWFTWLLYGSVIVGLGWVSHVNFAVLGRRLAVELVFVSLIIVGALFRQEGEVLWRWGWLHVTMPGLVLMGSVACKMVLSLLLLNLLTLTTSVSELLQGLESLKVSPLLISIIAAMYRYLGLLISEFQAMQRAAQARNLVTNAATIRLVVSHSIGSLFIRTYERGERIYQAMAARCYTSPDRTPNLACYHPRHSPQDYIAFTLTALILLGGQLSPIFSGLAYP